MRIKFLSFIVGFSMVSFIATSCLDNENEVTYSPDATIHAFEIDTIGYGKTYKFTIDQVDGSIYNVDSLPVNSDTIIKSILIKTLTTTSGIVTMKDQNGQDSIINFNDSINLLKYVNATDNNNYLILKVWAPDMQITKDYKLNVRMHKQVPDSLNWGNGPIADNPIPNTTEKQKFVILGNKILLFTANNLNVYSTIIPAGLPTDRLDYGRNWILEGTSDALFANADITSITSFSNSLYTLINNQVYKSEDGLTWTKDALLNPDGVSINKLIASFSNINGTNHNNIVGLSGIIEINNQKYFSFAKDDASWELNTDNLVAVPANFPDHNLSADVYSTESGVLNAIVVGDTKVGLSNDTATVVWGSEDGVNWIPMEISSNYNCPKLINPSIIRYNNAFYICGKENNDEQTFERFYTSPTLLIWTQVDNMFKLPGIFPPIINGEITQQPNIHPNGFKGKAANYSIIVDRNHFIWMIGGNDINKIWRGRMNKLGFLIQ